jgi:hypothetical protein
VPSGTGSKQHATGNLNPLSVDTVILASEQRHNHGPEVIGQRSAPRKLALGAGYEIVNIVVSGDDAFRRVG